MAKKAKKDNPAVAKGMPYYYMIFRGGASPTRPFGRAMKRYFASYPTASQRTMNAYKSSIRAISESLEDNDFYRSSFEDTVSNIVSQLEEIRDQAQESMSIWQYATMLNNQNQYVIALNGWSQ